LEKERGITIGHIDHGKTTLTEAIKNILVGQGKVYGVVVDDFRNEGRGKYKSLILEYNLIQIKKSKLNHNERKQIVSEVEKLIASGHITNQMLIKE